MKITEQEKKFLLYALAFIVVYYLIVKPILVKLKLKKDPEVIKTEIRKEEQLSAQIESDAKKQQPTKTVQEWQTIADQIYNNLRYSALDDNKADAGYQVSRVKNDADFWTLYKLFGKRREYLFGIPSGGLMDLSQFIKSNLKESAIDTINRNYASKKIKFRF